MVIRVVGVGAEYEDLVAVGGAVAVGVGFRWVGIVDFGVVAHVVIVGVGLEWIGTVGVDLVGVGERVAIGVGIVGVGATLLFVAIGQTISILIAIRIQSDRRGRRSFRLGRFLGRGGGFTLVGDPLTEGDRDITRLVIAIVGQGQVIGDDALPGLEGR